MDFTLTLTEKEKKEVKTALVSEIYQIMQQMNKLKSRPEWDEKTTLLFHCYDERIKCLRDVAKRII